MAIRLIIVFIAFCLFIGCDRSVDPEKTDTIVGIAKIEYLKYPLAEYGSETSFIVHIEGRILVYNEDSETKHQKSLNDLQGGEPILIVRRDQQYYWTVGGKLVPFN